MNWRFFVWFNLAILLALFFLRAKIQDRESTPPPVYGLLKAFNLTDQSGQAISLESLKGKIWVMNFIFARCPNQCPAMNVKMSALQKTLPKEVSFASVSVDPEHDTPAVLAEVAKRFNAEEGRWFFLTGERSQISGILSAAHLGDSGETSMHSLRFILIDKDGAVRGYYNSEEETPIENLKHDIKILLKG